MIPASLKSWKNRLTRARRPRLRACPVCRRIGARPLFMRREHLMCERCARIRFGNEEVERALIENGYQSARGR